MHSDFPPKGLGVYKADIQQRELLPILTAFPLSYDKPDYTEPTVTEPSCRCKSIKNGRRGIYFPTEKMYHTYIPAVILRLTSSLPWHN